jgi:thioredoxin-dependent peroxiredoxin
MRIQPGQPAPNFEVTDISNEKPIRLSDFAGSKLLISFHRYAACPLCNLHIHELAKNYETFQKNNLKVLAIFRSSVERTLDQYQSRSVPFPIAVDLTLEAYRDYGIEYSTPGMLVSFIHPRAMWAFFTGNMPGKIDGDVRTLPADFLITPEGTIAKTYYSSNITQHLSLSEIVDFAKAA